MAIDHTCSDDPSKGVCCGCCKSCLCEACKEALETGTCSVEQRKLDKCPSDTCGEHCCCKPEAQCRCRVTDTKPEEEEESHAADLTPEEELQARRKEAALNMASQTVAKERIFDIPKVAGYSVLADDADDDEERLQ